MIERLITNSLPSPLSERFLSRFFVGLARCVVLFQPFTQPLRSATRCRTGPYRNVVLVRLVYSSAPTRYRQSKTTKNRCRKRLLKKAPTRTIQVVLERQGADKTKREHAEEFWCLGGGHQITISPAFDRAVASASSGGCRFFFAVLAAVCRTTAVVFVAHRTLPPECLIRYRIIVAGYCRFC